VSQYDVAPGGTLTAKTPATVATGTNPFGVALSPDGRSAYVTNLGGASVSQYDVAPGGTLTAKTPATAATGTNPTGIALSPAQAPVAAFAAAPAPAGAASGFDASASSDPDGAVARYDWDFGDGTGAPNAGPRPTHVYALPGSYTATLTVTDDQGCSQTFLFTGQTAYCNGSATARTQRTVTIARDTTAPKITRAVADPARFAVAARSRGAQRRRRPARGTTFRYTLSEPARARFVLRRATRGRRAGGRCRRPTPRNRTRRRCTLLRRAGTLTHQGAAGRNARRFSGRIRRRALKPGRYTATLTATDRAGNRSRPARIRFRVVRG